MNWELWTGCCQISDGCANFATDFSLLKAGEWRGEAWAMIRERTDINFLILIKRIDRFPVSLPDDWDEGYDNVNIQAQCVKAGVTFWFKNTGFLFRHDGIVEKINLY